MHLVFGIWWDCVRCFGWFAKYYLDNDWYLVTLCGSAWEERICASSSMQLITVLASEMWIMCKVMCMFMLFSNRLTDRPIWGASILADCNADCNNGLSVYTHHSSSRNLQSPSYGCVRIRFRLMTLSPAADSLIKASWPSWVNTHVMGAVSSIKHA